MESLARLLQRAGAVKVMQFDINPEWPSLITYRHQHGLVPDKIVPNLQQTASRYLVPDDRDFFAVYRRTAGSPGGVPFKERPRTTRTRPEQTHASPDVRWTPGLKLVAAAGQRGYARRLPPETWSGRRAKRPGTCGMARRTSRIRFLVTRPRCICWLRSASGHRDRGVGGEQQRQVLGVVGERVPVPVVQVPRAQVVPVDE